MTITDSWQCIFLGNPLNLDLKRPGIQDFDTQQTTSGIEIHKCLRGELDGPCHFIVAELHIECPRFRINPNVHEATPFDRHFSIVTGMVLPVPGSRRRPVPLRTVPIQRYAGTWNAPRLNWT